MMQKRYFSSRNRFYAGYRKIRFLAKTGSLFSFSKPGSRSANDIPYETFRTVLLNSCLLFLIAYLIIFIIQLFITGFTAILFNIPAVVYYYDVDYLIRGVDWTPDSVSGVFSSGPIAMLVLSVFLYILYRAVETETGIMRLLLLWMIFHALTRFFGEILIGAILSKGFGFVILYMFVMDTGKVILTILGFVAMFTTGLLLTRQALFSANIYFNDLRRSYRLKFILLQFFLPYFIGNIVIMMIKMPQFSFFDFAVNASMILILIPVLIRSIGMEDMYFDEEQKDNKFRMILPIIAAVFILLYRVVLGFGIRL